MMSQIAAPMLKVFSDAPVLAHGETVGRTQE
jgi:hypothetical protein